MVGVKTEWIQTDSSETYSLQYFLEFKIEAGSVGIRLRNQSPSVTNMGRIWDKYGSIADKHFVGSLIDNKNRTGGWS
jgi:hypothetical protein